MSGKERRRREGGLKRLCRGKGVAMAMTNVVKCFIAPPPSEVQPTSQAVWKIVVKVMVVPTILYLRSILCPAGISQ